MSNLKLFLLLAAVLSLSGGLIYFLRYKPTLPSTTNQEKGQTSLPKQEATSTSLPSLTINNKVIPDQEYQEVFDLVEKILKDRDKSIARTNYLFITDELLKETVAKQGLPLKQLDAANLNKLQRLEQEIAYLKQELIDQSLSWYSGELYLMRFENPDSKSPLDELKKRAKTKIDQIRNDLVKGATFIKITDKYTNDNEVETLNYGQGFAVQFNKLTLGKPSIKSPEVLNTIKNLKKDQISEAFEMTDPDRPTPNDKTPFAYALVKIIDDQSGIADSFESLLEQAKKQANIVVK